MNPSNLTRREKDLLGTKDVPGAAYYGIQTLRALENFQLSDRRVGQCKEFVSALAIVKHAAANANRRIGLLPSAKHQAIVQACEDVAAGGYLS